MGRIKQQIRRAPPAKADSDVVQQRVLTGQRGVLLLRDIVGGVEQIDDFLGMREQCGFNALRAQFAEQTHRKDARRVVID